MGTLDENRRLKELVGGGYDEFWDFRGRYRVVKGGRASKKSKTAALWYIHNMMEHKGASMLAVRKTYNSLRHSCFLELKWAIETLGVADKWQIKTSPLEMTYCDGGHIFFKGLDDPLKLTSITTDRGKLCWLWIEEAYELDREADFNMLDESIRGKVSGDLFKQITLTFNPWSDRHWLKKRFFDAKNDPDILTITTTYKQNEFLDSSDLKLFERMKTENFSRFKVAGLGDWGVAEGLIYNNWAICDFTLNDVRRDSDFTRLLPSGRIEKSELVSAFGLDFGYTNDPTALCCMLINTNKRTAYVFDEIYGYGMRNRDIYEEICKKGYQKERIFADSAEPKSIDELYDYGLRRIKKARKGADSVNQGIQFIQGHRLVIHPNCVNFIKEVSTYSWRKNALGLKTNTPAGGFDHLMDAMRYAFDSVNTKRFFEF